MGKDYVEVSFIPDFKRFDEKGITKDTLELFSKRVYDLAGVLNGVNVFLNDSKIPINSF